MSVALPIVLVGLPGAGKSKVGRLLAGRLGVPHVDTDDLIVEREGRAISDIFATDGESAFRAHGDRGGRRRALTSRRRVTGRGSGSHRCRARPPCRPHRRLH